MLNKLIRPFKKRAHKLKEFVAPLKANVSKLLDKSSSFVEKFKAFKSGLKGLSDFQKLLLLTIAVVLPAGVILAAGLAAFFRRKK